jgi:hypothetical protein
MAQITINEGLAWLKTVKKRHEELLAQAMLWLVDGCT